jgi:NAD(P)-dependent dehydrogenase (short-subunit alcohol dehydrogenase family)
MTSGGGLGASTYEASKHAVEAFTNTLRLELKMFGIRVVALNPCFFDTPLTNGVQERFREQVLKKISPELNEEYGEGTFLPHYNRFLHFVQ